MHNDTFIKDSEIKIIKVISTKVIDQYVLADLVTEQFGRRTEKRHVFPLDIWQEMKERGYIE